jgi:chromosome segregation protein
LKPSVGIFRPVNHSPLRNAVRERGKRKEKREKRKRCFSFFSSFLLPLFSKGFIVTIRVRGITIQGFKSFGERVRLEFSPKVNAVIGPNGSGKSNVIEAIRWASHTARTRELRVKESTELIFHGSSGKQALNLAEVQLELEQPTGGLSIARRLYRDGDSDLELAGKNVRVRDLHDALRGSGLGPGGIAVVGQGEIGAVIGANPTTMLGYLEEAAGLSRATHRRAQSLERLEQARIHLSRAEDLTIEVKSRVAKLELEAVAAGEYTLLSSEMTELEGAVRRSRVRVLRDEIGKLKLELQGTEIRAENASKSVMGLSNNLEQLRLERESKQVAFAELTAEFERLRGEAKLARERAANADANAKSLESERLRLESELQVLAVQTVPLEPETPTDDLNALEAAFVAAKAALRVASQAELDAKIELSKMRSERDKLEREVRVQVEMSARADAERDTLAQELASAKAELEPAQLEAARTALALEETKTELETAQKGLDKFERESMSITATLSAGNSRQMELKAARAPLQKEFARLEAAKNSHSYLSEGSRRALASGVKGMIGPVSDLVRVPQHLETAVGAALGRRIENIVVENGEVAKKVIESLKKSGGRATFLPLDILRTRPRRNLPIAEETGVVGFAAELVESEYQVVLESLFGETLIVENLDVGLRLARAYRDRPRLVTREGELLEAGGAVTGGRGRDTTGETFAELRRLEETKNELETLEKEWVKLEKTLDANREIATQARLATTQMDARVSQLRRDTDAARQLALQMETKRESLAHRVNQLEQRLSKLEPVVAIQTDFDTAIPSLSPQEQIVQIATANIETARGIERQSENAWREAQNRAALHLEKQRAYQTALLRSQENQARASRIRERLESIHLQELELGTRLEQANPEIVALEQQAENLGVTQAKDDLELLEKQRVNLETELSKATRSVSSERENIETARLAIARRETNLETVETELLESNPHFVEQTIESSESRVTMKVAPTREQVLEALLQIPDPEGTPRSWVTRVNQIRNRLDEIGAVNMLAAEEFTREQTRLHELETGVADSLAAVQELEVALDELERDVTARLKESIARVGTAFREYSTELLGGEGELETIRDETGALEGLALRVTPKGKRTRALHLLSTGERTMAALGFLFALSRAPEGHAGLPFAALDEVDAPLDEANIRRFTHFLRLLADQGTQFILVTHQKATMEIADALWGVTTDTGGISRVYSIKNETQANAAD